MSVMTVAAQANNFLVNANNRDKMARFTISFCRLLVEYLNRPGATANKEVLSQLVAVSDALKTTRNSFTWLRQIPFAVALSKMTQLQSLASYCSAANKICMIAFVTLRNIEWLIGMKILKGNQGYFLKLAFKFYTFAWLFELIPRIMKAQQGKPTVEDNLLTLRDALLVLEGMATVGWQKVDGKILALIGMFSSGYECYLAWV